MRKNIKILLVFILVALGMTSCVSRRKSYGAPAKEKFEKIIEAIENNDPTSLKAMFSINTLKEVENIEVEIQCLLNIYKGKFESILESTPSGSGSLDKGVITYEIMGGGYLFKTDEGTYKLIFDDITVDSDPDNIGLTRIVFFKEEDKELFYNGDTRTGKGVH